MAISLVNTAQNFTQSPGSANVNGAAASLTANNLIVVCIGYTQGSGETVSSVTDTAGNTYLSAVADDNPNTASYRSEIWYKENAAGNGSNTPVVTFSGTGQTYVTVLSLQYSGVATSSAIDGTAGCSAHNGNDITTAGITTTVADTVIVAAAWLFHDSSAGWTPPTNYTNQIQTTNKMGAAFDRIVTATQSSVALTASNAETSGLVMVAAAFEQASGGGGATRVPGTLLTLGVG